MKAIGKYQLLEKIGAGAAGITYRARDTFRNRELALKVLHSSLVANPEWKEQFSAELGLCADLRNSIFVKILDLGEVEEVIYIATDLLTGVDLRCHLAEGRILTLDQNLEYIAQVCDGLAFAHSKGIAHGNIKPSNLFVIAGKDARILDLGLAGWLASVLAMNGQQVELFPNYFAPEQILGQKFDARSDIFSVGVVLYELLTQKHPFAADANLIPREIVHAEPEPLRKLNPNLPEELEQLVMRALHKDPEQRLGSAEEFRASLVRMAQKLQDEESPSSALTMTPRPMTPRPSSPASAGPPVEFTATPSASASPAPQPVTPLSSTPVNALEHTPRPPSPPLKPAVPASPAETPVAAPIVKPAAIDRPAAPPTKTAARPTAQLRESVAGLLSKPVALIAAAAVLALCIVVSVVSRQGLRASPPKSASPVVPIQAAAPEVKAAAPEAKAVAPEAKAVAPPARAEEPAAIKPSAENPKTESHEPSPAEILRSQVKPLWESGKYDQALRLVNAILADTPDQADALAWKKKIRSAQQAEAAIQ